MLKTILDYDNPVMSFISRLIDLFTLSLLWLLCSLPIITIGAANCSLYYAVIKSVRHQRSYPVKEFFKCFPFYKIFITFLTSSSNLSSINY